MDHGLQSEKIGKIGVIKLENNQIFATKMFKQVEYVGYVLKMPSDCE